jgi:regulatory protein
MNPIKNKKDLETTIDDIRNFAYLYLEKYSSSKQQLRTYLFKKLIKKKQKISSKKEIFNLIDTVIFH